MGLREMKIHSETAALLLQTNLLSLQLRQDKAFRVTNNAKLKAVAILTVLHSVIIIGEMGAMPTKVMAELMR